MYFFPFDLVPYLATISRLMRVFDDTDVNLRTGKPRMWWSFLPFTSDLELKTVYECKKKIIARFVDQNNVTLFSVHQNNVYKLNMSTDTHNYRYMKKVSAKNMTRILLPTRPLQCSESYSKRFKMSFYQYQNCSGVGASKNCARQRNFNGP